MKDKTCDTCDGDGHNEDIIWVEDKSFCPNTFRRIFWVAGEGDGMSVQEFAEASLERIKMVRPSRPAKYVIVKDDKK